MADLAKKMFTSTHINDSVESTLNDFAKGGSMLSNNYIAGFFDGEGCVYINPNGRVSVSITQKKPEVLHMISEIYNGHIRVHDRASRTFRLELTSKVDIIKFLEKMYELCVIKKEEINIGLQAASLIREKNLGCTPFSVDEFNERQAIRLKMQQVRPTTMFSGEIAQEKKERDDIKSACNYKCQICWKDLKGEKVINQIITRDKKLICRKCHPQRFPPNNLKPRTKEEIINAIEVTSSFPEAAKLLEISVATLYDKRKKLGLIQPTEAKVLV